MPRESDAIDHSTVRGKAASAIGRSDNVSTGYDPGDSRPEIADAAETTATHEQLPGRADSANRFPFILFPDVVRRGFSRMLHSRRTPAFLVSFVLHVALLLLLALLSVSTHLGSATEFDFQLKAPSSSTVQTVPLLQLATGDAPPPPTNLVSDSPQLRANSQTEIGTQFSELLRAERETAMGESQSQRSLEQLIAAAASSLSASFASTGVEGRSPQQRERLARQRGGTIESEQAVERALQWLAGHQLPNGSWSLLHDSGQCNSRCRNSGSKGRFDPAATGLSLLAFLGAGYTHREGKHRETVNKGIYFLLQILEETPEGGSYLYRCDRGMYNHGIATFALCEAYQLTLDNDLLKPAQKAVDFIVHAQNYAGGWGYSPKQPGDLTISGWQSMALKSAVAAGLDVPAYAVLRIDEFLDSQTTGTKVYYGYAKPGMSPTCTSIGLLLRLFRGWPHTDPRILEGAEFLQKQGPSASDIYFNYYATLYLFHVGGGLWDAWNPRVRDYLVKTQATEGHETGSWYFENAYGQEGGRLYTTAMAAMTLQVYYRFAPLYQQSDLPFEL